MVKKVEILHIYSGTSGIAGLYLDSIYHSLKGSKQEVIVSYHFPFNYGKKVFYRYTDLTVKNKYRIINKFRFLFRTIEFIYGLLFSLIYILIKKPRIVNYSLISTFQIEYYFLKLINILPGTMLFITCHDVIPHANDYTKFDKDVVLRKKIFNLADKLLVHNLNSIDDLQVSFDIKRDQINLIPFPIMDIKKIMNYYVDRNDKLVRFVFVGHLRNEKGINTLIKAWNIFYDKNKNAELVIAGNIPRNSTFDFSLIKSKGFVFIGNYITDDKYYELLSISDFVVLPYNRGTNSGIPSTVLTMDKIALTSDIPMFKNNNLIHEKMKFTVNDEYSLARLLDYAYNMNNLEYASILDELHLILENYINDFSNTQKLIYSVK